MMVFKQAITRYPDDRLLHIASLLHDIGKIEAREVVTKVDNSVKVVFHGHEGVSIFYALDVLNSESFKVLELSNEDKVLILNTISLHGAFFDSFDSGKKQEKMEYRFKNNTELFEMIRRHLICDHNGRLSLENHNSDVIENYKSNVRAIFGRNAFITFTKELVVLVGPPCSGKSTFIKDCKFRNHVIISRDDILINYKEEYKHLKYSEIYKTLSEDDHKNIDKLVLQKYQEAIRNNENIIIDMTNSSSKSRRKWSTPKHYNRKAFVFYNSYDELIKRNSIRKEQGKDISNKTFINMFKSFTTPLYDEFDEIEYIM
jgi:predicted kinase